MDIDVTSTACGILYYHILIYENTFSAVPSAVRFPAIFVLSFNSIRVQWTDPLTPNGIILTYSVYIIRSPSELSELHQTSSKQLSLSGFNPYELVCFMVSATNIAGEGPNSTQHCTRTHQAGAYTHITCIHCYFLYYM